MGKTLSQLPFVKVIDVGNKQIPPEFSSFHLEKDFHFLLSLSSHSRSLSLTQECINFGEQSFRLVYAVRDDGDPQTFFRYKFCESWWDVSKHVSQHVQ